MPARSTVSRLRLRPVIGNGSKRIRVNTLGSDSADRLAAHAAAAHVVSAALQNQHDIEGSAAAGAGQQQLHRPRSEVAPTCVRCAVHRDEVTRAGFGDEAHAVEPLDRAFHPVRSFGPLVP